VTEQRDGRFPEGVVGGDWWQDQSKEFHGYPNSIWEASEELSHGCYLEQRLEVSKSGSATRVGMQKLAGTQISLG
jgi:hypothetical protein